MQSEMSSGAEYRERCVPTGRAVLDEQSGKPVVGDCARSRDIPGPQKWLHAIHLHSPDMEDKRVQQQRMRTSVLPPPVQHFPFNQLGMETNAAITNLQHALLPGRKTSFEQDLIINRRFITSMRGSAVYAGEVRHQ